MVETKYPQAIFPDPGVWQIPLKSQGVPSQQLIMEGSVCSRVCWLSVTTSEISRAVRAREYFLERLSRFSASSKISF